MPVVEKQWNKITHAFVIFMNYTSHFHHLPNTSFYSPQQMCEIRIASTIVTVFHGWRSRHRVALAAGSVWTAGWGRCLAQPPSGPSSGCHSCSHCFCSVVGWVFTKLKPAGITPGFELIIILRERESSCDSKSLMKQALWAAAIAPHVHSSHGKDLPRPPILRRDEEIVAQFGSIQG